MKHTILHLFLTTAILFGATCLASAATITFRGERIACHGAAVILADVANITPDEGETPDEIERLKKVVLFPAPISGKDRTITYREIYDYLKMRGIQVGLHTFAGSPQVTVTAAPPQTSTQNQPGNERPFVRQTSQPNNTATDEIEEVVRHAVLTFLEQNVTADIPWRVAVTLSEEGRRRITTGGGIGGISWTSDENRNRNASQFDPAEAWLGRQRFELQLKRIASDTGMHGTMFVEVNISLPKAIVVTRYAIPRGKVISAADVKLQYLDNMQMPSNVTKSRTAGGVTLQRDGELEIDPDIATRIESVVGKATLRAMRNDMPVQLSQIELPVMVKKSDVVTLFVRNGGITIKMIAKAKEDGKEGDLITVESLTDKQTNLARVVDYGVVEIEMAHSTTTQLAKAR